MGFRKAIACVILPRSCAEMLQVKGHNMAQTKTRELERWGGHGAVPLCSRLPIGGRQVACAVGLLGITRGPMSSAPLSRGVRSCHNWCGTMPTHNARCFPNLHLYATPP